MNENPYKQFSASFDAHLAAIVNTFPTEPANLYEPVTYFLSLGGKRVRPLLALIAADLNNKDVTKALPAAAAVELFHNFSLIHDDIMDKAPLRRGKETVHKKWNSNIAILSGDVLLVKAYAELAKCDPSILAEMMGLFSKTAREVCEGQQLDMDFENRHNVTIAEYIHMIRLKTAVLLGCSLQMGAMAVNADKKEAALLYKAGEKLGIAFQLTDDYLDAFGNTQTFGKQSGGDIIANKKTWLLLKALETANDGQKQELQHWLKKDDDTQEKVKEVKNIFSALKVDGLIQQEIDVYYKEAESLLLSSSAGKEKIKLFLGFAGQLMQRSQ